MTYRARRISRRERNAERRITIDTLIACFDSFDRRFEDAYNEMSQAWAVLDALKGTDHDAQFVRP